MTVNDSQWQCRLTLSLWASPGRMHTWRDYFRLLRVQARRVRLVRLAGRKVDSAWRRRYLVLRPDSLAWYVEEGEEGGGRPAERQGARFSGWQSCCGEMADLQKWQSCCCSSAKNCTRRPPTH